MQREVASRRGVVRCWRVKHRRSGVESWFCFATRRLRIAVCGQCMATHGHGNDSPVTAWHIRARSRHGVAMFWPSLAEYSNGKAMSRKVLAWQSHARSCHGDAWFSCAAAMRSNEQSSNGKGGRGFKTLSRPTQKHRQRCWFPEGKPSVDSPPALNRNCRLGGNRFVSPLSEVLERRRIRTGNFI